MSGAHDSGYSGKPVWQKLGLQPGMRVCVRGAPADYAALTEAHALALQPVGARGAFDAAHVFATSAALLRKDIAMLARRLPAAAMLWVSWPKKSAKLDSDVTEDTIREIALPLGLVDVKVCAIDATWSGLKLVWRREHRAGKA
jgi:hypothetical protein